MIRSESVDVLSHRCGTIVMIAMCSVLVATSNVIAEDVPTKQARVTDPFRAEHAAIQEHLNHMTSMVGELASLKSDEQKETMAHIAHCMTEHVVNHARWEEAVLYPVVDSLAGVGMDGMGLTSSMRHEHKIVGRWVDELRSESEKSEPDVSSFARRADNLLGLIAAHFEEEEEVLLPILDAKMTADQFKTEISDKMDK